MTLLVRLLWSAAYNNSWWSSTEVTTAAVCCRLTDFMTTHHLPRLFAHSRQQLPGIDFFPLFSPLCLVEASSCSVLFFPLTVSFKAVRWQSTDSTDRKSIQSHPSRRSLSSYLDILTARGGGRTQVCLFHTHIQKKKYIPLFSEVYLSISNPRKVHWVGWLFSFLLNGLMEQWQSQRGRQFCHIWFDSRVPQKTKPRYLQWSPT